jgi:RimJ/RimL family protein N-acetyltransferase
MEQQAPNRSFRLRDFTVEDIPHETMIHNRTYPDEPVTVEMVEHWERTYPQDNPRLRYVVEWEDDQVVASGSCMHPIGMTTPGAYWVDVMVHPDFRHRGIGQALLAAVEPFGWSQGAARLWANCREDSAESIAFAQSAGYTNIGIRFESALDLDAFDETPFAHAFQRIAQAGYTITTHAAERAVHPDADQRLFELYRQALADVPFPGGARIEPVFETWRTWMLEGPATDPAAIFLAKRNDELVGLTALELLVDGPAITGSTGVLRKHRGRGLGMALKLASFRFMQERGYHETRAHNDTANPPILQLNAKLGYRRLPGWLAWEKMRALSA